MSKTITVTEFKAQCLSLLDHVIESREDITITHRGKPAATLRAMCPKLGGSWEGLIEVPDTVEGFDLIYPRRRMKRAKVVK